MASKIDKAVTSGRLLQELMMEAGERYTKALKRQRQAKAKPCPVPTPLVSKNPVLQRNVVRAWYDALE